MKSVREGALAASVLCRARNNAARGQPRTTCAQPAKDANTRAPAGLSPRHGDQEDPIRPAETRRTRFRRTALSNQRLPGDRAPSDKRRSANRQVRGVASYLASGLATRHRARYRGLQPRRRSNALQSPDCCDRLLSWYVQARCRPPAQRVCPLSTQRLRTHPPSGCTCSEPGLETFLTTAE